jgi:glutamine amidotransferase PdxT
LLLIETKNPQKTTKKKTTTKKPQLPQAQVALFNGINGLLLPGGGVYSIGNSSSPFLSAARFLYNLAMDANANGDYFPVWGTCMGFEMLVMLTANSTAPRSCGTYHTVLYSKTRGRV